MLVNLSDMFSDSARIFLIAGACEYSRMTLYLRQTRLTTRHWHDSALAGQAERHNLASASVYGPCLKQQRRRQLQPESWDGGSREEKKESIALVRFGFRDELERCTDHAAGKFAPSRACATRPSSTTALTSSRRSTSSINSRQRSSSRALTGRLRFKIRVPFERESSFDECERASE